MSITIKNRIAQTRPMPTPRFFGFNESLGHWAEIYGVPPEGTYQKVIKVIDYEDFQTQAKALKMVFEKWLELKVESKKLVEALLAKEREAAETKGP